MYVYIYIMLVYVLSISDQMEEGKSDEPTRKVLKNKQRLKLPPSLLRLANEKTQVCTIFVTK